MKKILLIIAVMMLIPLVSSIPPFTITQQFQTGYAIVDTPQVILKQNQDFTYNFFVYNLSNGNLIDNSSTECIFYLANSSGDVVYIDNVTFVPGLDYWEIIINGGNFSELGEYSYGTQCQSTAVDYGGTIIGTWKVTYAGIELTTERAILNIGFLFMLLLLIAGTIIGINAIPNKNYVDEEGMLQILRVKYLRNILWLFVYGLVMGVVFIISNIAYVFSSNSLIPKFFFMIFQIMMVLSPVVILIAIIFIIVKVFQDIAMEELIERGEKYNG